MIGKHCVECTKSVWCQYHLRMLIFSLSYLFALCHLFSDKMSNDDKIILRKKRMPTAFLAYTFISETNFRLPSWYQDNRISLPWLTGAERKSNVRCFDALISIRAVLGRSLIWITMLADLLATHLLCSPWQCIATNRTVWSANCDDARPLTTWEAWGL